MMHSDDDYPNSTRRCLFPEEDDVVEEELMSSMPLYQTDENDWAHYRSSPTSVSGYPGLSSSNEKALRSTITMSEQGAEVTLDDLLSTPHKPSKRTGSSRRSPTLGTVRSSSLLDVETTPASTGKSDGYGLPAYCCTIPDQHNLGDDTPNREIEESITSLLGDSERTTNPFDACSAWHAWSLFAENEGDMSKEDMEKWESSFRNSAHDRGARNSKVRQLRRDLSPFASSPQNQGQVFRSRSFSVADHAAAIVRGSKKSKKNSFSTMLQLCTMPENATSESPMIVKYNPQSYEGEDELCYDSDPEDFARRRSPRRTPHRDRRRRLEERRRHTPVKLSPCQVERRLAISTEESARVLVQEFLNSTTTLVFHPTLESESGELEPATPVAVDAWVERGQRLYDIIQPKFMWRLKPRYKQDGGASVQMLAVRGIELLNFSRILTVDRVDRMKYPLAKPSACLLIRTIEDEEFCFEADSVKERDHLVYALKMVIARFGAMVLMGDKTVYTDFFPHTDAFVPGKSPRVTCLLEEHSDGASSEDDC